MHIISAPSPWLVETANSQAWPHYVIRSHHTVGLGHYAEIINRLLVGESWPAHV